MYGYELIVDLKGCESATFSRPSLDRFFTELCELIEMEKCEVYFWDDVGVPVDDQQTEAHTKGTSAVCFILTSTIVVHTLDLLGSVYINIFSCKSFDANTASEFSEAWFNGHLAKSTFIERI